MTKKIQELIEKAQRRQLELLNLLNGSFKQETFTRLTELRYPYGGRAADVLAQVDSLDQYRNDAKERL